MFANLQRKITTVTNVLWAFPGQGPGRVLLAEHARLIEPLTRLATKVRRPLTQKGWAYRPPKIAILRNYFIWTCCVMCPIFMT